MVVLQSSIPCVNSIQDPISNGGEVVGHQVDSINNSKEDFMVVSDASPLEKRTRCKVTVKRYEKKSVDVVEVVDSEKVPSSERRRCSARIQDKLKKEKILRVHKRVEPLDDTDDSGGGGSRKKTRVYQRRKGNFTSPNNEPEVFHAGLGSNEATHGGEVGGGEAMNGGVNGVVAGNVSGGNVVEKSAYVRFKERLMNNRSRGGENGAVGDGNPGNVVEKSAHAKVKETLRMFNKYYLHYVQVSFYIN